MLRQERWFLVFVIVQNVTCVDTNKIHDGNKPHLLRFNATFFHFTIQGLTSLLWRQENRIGMRKTGLSPTHKTGLE